MRKKIALLKRWINILTGKSATAVKQDIGKYYKADVIKGYYNDLTGKVGPGTETDDYGMPVTEIASGEKVYFPIAVFQYGLAQHDLFIATQDRAHLDALRTIADWAVLMQRGDGSWDAFGPVKSRKYTVSSMCQGEGASLLFRAAKVFNAKYYGEAAFRAIDFMLKPLEEGGTAIYDGDDLYLEEYPQTPKRSVLNGWIFSIFGLYDAALMNAKYQPALDRTLDTLCRVLPEYDCGYWSLYDLQGKIASPAYHDLHISLLTVLFNLTKRNDLQAAAGKFRTYTGIKVLRVRAVIKKAAQKITERSDVITIK